MVLVLIGLRADLTSLRDQILSSLFVRTLEEVFTKLLCITSTPLKVNSCDVSSLLSKLTIFKVDIKKEKGGSINIALIVIREKM